MQTQRYIYNAFVNGEEAELDMTEAEIRADEICGAFNNEKKGKQKHNKAKFGRYSILKDWFA